MTPLMNWFSAKSSCKCTPPKFRVGQKVWSEISQQYGIVVECSTPLPSPCASGCVNTPCAKCGGNGVDELAKKRRCGRCGGRGTEPKS